MFFKTLKFDLKNAFQDYVVIYFIALTFLIILPLGELETFRLMRPLISVFYGIVIISLLIIAFYNIVRFFNRVLFSDAGYLTLTLPVSQLTSILSKIVASLIFTVLTLLLDAFIVTVYSKTELLAYDALKYFGFLVGTFGDFFKSLSNIGTIWYGILMIFGIIFIILVGLLALTINNTSFMKIKNNLIILVIVQGLIIIKLISDILVSKLFPPEIKLFGTDAGILSLIFGSTYQQDFMWFGYNLGYSLIWIGLFLGIILWLFKHKIEL